MEKSEEKFYRLKVAGLERDLPICRINDSLYIAAFVIFGDVELTVSCARELIKYLPEHDVMITAEAKGIPLIHEMARQYGVNRYIVARKSPKLYMKEPFAVEVQSITTAKRQTLYIDGRDAEYLKGKRVVIIDDVISTGESVRAVEHLVEQAGGTVVGRLAILAEGDAAQRQDIKYLAELPLFDDKGVLVETKTKEDSPVLVANAGKNTIIEVDGKQYERLPIKTHVITDKDKIADVAVKYVKSHIQSGDILFISEKAVACSQKRAIPLTEIKPRPLAKFLVKFVYKSPYGIGLGIPETMEMALRECGVLRILFAAAISAIGKLLGKRGWFYKVAGYKAESIDGPTPYTLPPYNKCVVLGPEEPDKVAAQIAQAVGCKCAIVDINDLKGKVLGISHPDMDREKIARILKDNPLGQANQQTPMGIIRESK